VLDLHLFGRERTVSKAGTPNRNARSTTAGWNGQTGVADHDEVRVHQPTHGAREVRVDDAAASQNASTTSGVGRAPWAPSFVTAAAPARTA
jgi:hypothetical protein